MEKTVTNKFQKQISEILDRSYIDDKLQISWTTGGLTGGNCWGDSADTPVQPESEPDFYDLDKVLEALCPNISFLQYKKLCASVVELSNKSDSSDYYGNVYYQSVKTVKLDKLKKYLEENNLWQE